MNRHHVAELTRSFRRRPSRRDLLHGLTCLGLGCGLLGLADPSAARKKRKKQRKTCAKAGQQTNKKRKKCCQGLVKEAAGRCAAPPQRCACPGDHICLPSGECQLCNVTCASGNPVICGALLQTVLNLGEILYICPGLYRGNFTAAAAVTAIGAGEGDDPASNAILDGGGEGAVLTISSGVGPIELARLRLTGGESGINHRGTTLRMTECTVSGNTGSWGIQTIGTLELTRCTVSDNRPPGFANSVGISTAGVTTLTDCLIENNGPGGDGGGIHLFSGTTTLAGNTQVRRNAATRGGGIYVNQGTLEIAETCRVTENTATAMGDGGGIYNSSEFGVITLHGADPSPIVVDNCHENCAGPGGVPTCAATPVSCPPKSASRGKRRS